MKPNFEKYQAVSALVRAELEHFGPLRTHSLDEAYVDRAPAIHDRSACD